MIGILKYSSVKTDTISFRKYRKVAVENLIESHRVSFSKGDYRFQTKRVSNEVLADELGVTKRYIRMLLRILEITGILTIRRRRVGRFMNLWNAFEFTGFMEWLTRYAQSRCTPVPPKEESNLRLPFRTLAFPTSYFSSFNPRHACRPQRRAASCPLCGLTRPALSCRWLWSSIAGVEAYFLVVRRMHKIRGWAKEHSAGQAGCCCGRFVQAVKTKKYDGRKWTFSALVNTAQT